MNDKSLLWELTQQESIENHIRFHQSPSSIFNLVKLWGRENFILFYFPTWEIKLASLLHLHWEWKCKFSYRKFRRSVKWNEDDKVQTGMNWTLQCESKVVEMLSNLINIYKTTSDWLLYGGCNLVYCWFELDKSAMVR